MARSGDAGRGAEETAFGMAFGSRFPAAKWARREEPSGWASGSVCRREMPRIFRAFGRRTGFGSRPAKCAAARAGRRRLEAKSGCRHPLRLRGSSRFREGWDTSGVPAVYSGVAAGALFFAILFRSAQRRFWASRSRARPSGERLRLRVGLESEEWAACFAKWPHLGEAFPSPISSWRACQAGDFTLDCGNNLSEVHTASISEDGGGPWH
jgi:hypothetical protein